MTTEPIAYVEHPCSKAEKKAYNREGFKVIDVKYRPVELADGDKVFMKPKTKAKK